jgi:hypothetical protein
MFLVTYRKCFYFKRRKKLTKTGWYLGWQNPYRYGWYERSKSPQERDTFMSFYMDGQWYFQDHNGEFIESNHPHYYWRGLKQ